MQEPTRGGIARLNNGSGKSPSLRLDLNIATLWNLPEWSRGPHIRDLTGTCEDMRRAGEAGYEGVQTYDPAPVFEAGLRATGMARVLSPRAVKKVAALHKEAGLDATTLHVGTGFETDDEMDAFAYAVLAASDELAYPLFVETHRATITQDIKRTLDLVHRWPDLRFNADLAHWYTGHELTYGDFDMKLRLMAPVLERVRFVHGRLGDSGRIQLSLEGRSGQPFVKHFKQMWTVCFDGFLRDARAGDFIVFAPELLPSVAAFEGVNVRLNYAQEHLEADGTWCETGDRWGDALMLCDMAKCCFANAHAAQRGRDV